MRSMTDPITRVLALTAIPVGERWTLKIINSDGSKSRAGDYASRGDALQEAAAIAKLMQTRVLR